MQQIGEGDDLPGDVLGDRESDDVGGPPQVPQQPVGLGQAEPASVLPQPQNDLVGIDGVHIQVDGHAAATGLGQPLEQGPTGVAQLLGAEGGRPLGADLRVRRRALPVGVARRRV